MGILVHPIPNELIGQLSSVFGYLLRMEENFNKNGDCSSRLQVQPQPNTAKRSLGLGLFRAKKCIIN